MSRPPIVEPDAVASVAAAPSRALALRLPPGRLRQTSARHPGRLFTTLVEYVELTPRPATAPH